MSKLRLKYDIIAKRAEETESGVNIDEALRRRKTEIQNISNSLNQTNVEVQHLGDTVNAAVEVVDGMNDRVTAVEDSVSETSGDLIMLADYVDGLAVDIENKLDREDSAYFYPMETNPSGYLTDADLSEYAKQQWVEDQGYLKSADLSDYAKTADVDIQFDETSAWAKSVFASATQLSDYYPKTETSGANELRAEFEKYQPSGKYVTSAGLDAELVPYAKTDDVNQSILQATSGKLDKSSSGDFYPMSGNPSNFLVQADLAGYATETYVNQETSGKLDKSESANYWPQTSANALIPAGTDASNQLVNELGLATAMADFGGFKKSTPDASGKPTESDPSTKIIYLTYVSSASAPDKYNEWIWDSDENDYELIGDTTLDLTGYATENYVDQHTSGKMDKSTSAQFYPRSTNPEHYVTSGELSTLSAKIESDIPSIAGLAAESWVQANFASASQLNDYYPNTNPSGFLNAIPSEYITETELESELGSYAEVDVLNYVSAAVDSLKDDVDYVSGAFEGYATTQDLIDGLALKLNKTDSGAFYPMVGNPSNFLTSIPDTYATKTYVEQETSGKVDKETGKGLSTNDFTNSLKTKLTEIETSAQMNVIEVVKVDDTALPITNKSVNVTLSGKVDKIEGKGLSTNDLTDAYVTTIETAAEVIPSDADENNQLVSTDTLHAAIADFGGFMKVPGDSSGYPVVSDPDTRTIYLVKDTSITSGDVYAEWIWNSASPSVWEMVGDTQIDLDGYVEYPSTHIDQHIVLFGPGDTIVDSQMTLDDVHGDVSGVTVAGGSELTITDRVVDIPAAYANNGTYYPGVMSALDKEKLDTINASAERNVQSDWNESDPTSDAYIKNKPAQLELIGRDGIEVSATQNSVYVSVSGNYLVGEAASGLDVPMKVMVVSTMPSSFDPNTIYLVQGTMYGN